MGIDYGLGKTNIDTENGIRYGVISQHEVGQAWYDESEAYYGSPHCPECGNELQGDGKFEIGEEVIIDNVNDGNVRGKIIKISETSVFIDVNGKKYRRDFDDVYPCNEQTFDDGHECSCGYTIKWIGEECYGDEPRSHYVDDGKYSAKASFEGDIFITKSPFYTKCAFCSPCAPGAGYLTSEGDDCKAYCFGPEWFDGDPPHTVYRVSDDSLVNGDKYTLCQYRVSEDKAGKCQWVHIATDKEFGDLYDTDTEALSNDPNN